MQFAAVYLILTTLASVASTSNARTSYARPRGGNKAKNSTALRATVSLKRYELFSFLDTRQNCSPCPNNPGLCSDPGYFCCNDGGECPDGQKCVGSDSCCLSNDVVCSGGSGCCPFLEFCCNDAGGDCCPEGDSCCFQDGEPKCCGFLAPPSPLPPPPLPPTLSSPQPSPSPPPKPKPTTTTTHAPTIPSPPANSVDLPSVPAFSTPNLPAFTPPIFSSSSSSDSAAGTPLGSNVGASSSIPKHTPRFSSIAMICITMAMFLFRLAL